METSANDQNKERFVIDESEPEIESVINSSDSDSSSYSLSIDGEDVILITSKISEKFTKFLNGIDFTNEVDTLDIAMKDKE